jgi:peptide/nickel transport system permease protein
LGRLLIRRFLLLFLVLLGISLLTFFLSRIVPADPARMIAGPRASAEGVEKVRQDYGLDLPLWQQYLRYIGNLLRLDFGYSFSSLRPVREDLAEFLGATVELAFSALILAVLFGIPIGVLSAVRQDSIFDRITRLLAVGALSLPAFWLALLAQLFLYQQLGWLPFGGRLGGETAVPPRVTGLFMIDSLLAGQLDTFGDVLHHLLLPALILSLTPLAVLARIMRTSMLEVIREQYVTTALAKGLRGRVVILRHALKNAMLPVVTMIGLQIGYLLGGSVLIETVFAWPGIGRYSARAIVSADYNVVMAVTLVVATIYLVTNVIVDLVYAWLDPRIRY